ncbi:hypothetical protein [Thiomonas sp. X19]|uniref:hypothetical protein n=1 Tax=Thiomonas sp. X19 TaxID=1050370 RepID=UPI001314D66A|nr:hypothetical protein [Thiomonas sp. X19]
MPRLRPAKSGRRRRIEQFAADWNQHAKLLAWAAIAESILEMLARLSKAISGTAH